MKQSDIKRMVTNELYRTWQDKDGNICSHSRDERNIFEMLLKEAKMFSVKMNGNSAYKISIQILKQLK